MGVPESGADVFFGVVLGCLWKIKVGKGNLDDSKQSSYIGQSGLRLS